MYISANPRPGVKVEDLERGIDEEIQEAANKGATPEELAKSKTQLLRRFVEQRRSSLGTANLIGRYAIYFDDPNLINTVINKQEAVMLDQVNAVAKKYLVREQRAVVTTLPAKMGTAASSSQ